MWYLHLEKNTFISNLYNEVPQLKNVRIAQLKILDEGDRVSLAFDMPCFADQQPKKWVGLDYNTVFVELDFFDIKEVMVKSASNKYRGNITITKDKDNIIIVDVTGSVEAIIKAGFGMVQSVEGYCNQQQL